VTSRKQQLTREELEDTPREIPFNINITFDGNPKHLRKFCEGVEAARQVVHPLQHPLVLKFIESKITGEAKERLLARTERHTWEQINATLEENYAVRTLEYYASILFTTKQGMNETVAQWGSRINMGIDLIREARARIEKINPRAVGGGTSLVSEFMKGSFVAGLKDDRIKYVVKATGEDNSIAQLLETALQEESEVKSQKFKGNQGIGGTADYGRWISDAQWSDASRRA
jgi:DNA-directed RNA polymerase subunit L